jgi:hypothetical protein
LAGLWETLAKSYFTTNKSLLFWEVLGFFHTTKINGIEGYGEELTFGTESGVFVSVIRRFSFFSFFPPFFLVVQ